MTNRTEKAEQFVNQLIGQAEHIRRRYRNLGALPQESHEARTTYLEIGEFTCQGCRAVNALSPPVRPADHRPCLLVCGQCGDATRIVFVG